MKALRVVNVPVDSIEPNPWNPNRQDERTYEAERESIREYGFIDPVTVREHPDDSKRYQIIDGEHRWRAAQDEGLETIPVLSLVLDNAAAKKLTVILNETRGSPDLALLGSLLRNIETELQDSDSFRLGLSYTEAELKRLTDPEPLPDDVVGEQAEQPAPPAVYELTLVFDNADRLKQFRSYVRMMSKEYGTESETDTVSAVLAKAAKNR